MKEKRSTKLIKEALVNKQQRGQLYERQYDILISLLVTAPPSEWEAILNYDRAYLSRIINRKQANLSFEKITALIQEMEPYL